MLKLKRYLKPYIALFLGAIILLFGQALLELTLPNYMSDIVNVGLQQGGITYSAPDAIDAQSMQLMQLFMSEEDRATIDGVYTQLSEGEQLTELQKTYPNLKARDYVLIEERSEGTDAADAAFPALLTRWCRRWSRLPDSLSSPSGRFLQRQIPNPPLRERWIWPPSTSCCRSCKTRRC